MYNLGFYIIQVTADVAAKHAALAAAFDALS